MQKARRMFNVGKIKLKPSLEVKSHAGMFYGLLWFLWKKLKLFFPLIFFFVPKLIQNKIIQKFKKIW
jgi:hypothetical protein